MTLRRFSVVIGAICLTLAVAYGGYWWVVAGNIRDGIAEWAEARRAEGFELTYEGLAIDGFPGRIAITLTRPSVARPESGGAAGWRWRAPRLAAEMSPFALGRIAITLPDVQRLDYGGRQMEITVARGVAVYTPPGEAPESLAVEASAIAVASPGGRFTLDSLTGLIRRGGEALIELEIDGLGLTLAARVKTILGREIKLVAVTASHDGALPEDFSGPALAAWSTGGGTVEFERLDLEWGAVEIAAEGTLTLDAELRPEAAFSAEIAGYGGLFDGLAESGGMKPRDASFAKTFLNLMAKRVSGRRVIKVALTAQNGTLFVGPLPLIKLAPVF
jgi:hypothetical protein